MILDEHPVGIGEPRPHPLVDTRGTTVAKCGPPDVGDSTPQNGSESRHVEDPCSPHVTHTLHP
jgi:hypothetical protein